MDDCEYDPKEQAHKMAYYFTKEAIQNAGYYYRSRAPVHISVPETSTPSSLPQFILDAQIDRYLRRRKHRMLREHLHY